MRLAASFILLVAALVGAITLGGAPADAELVLIVRGDVFTLDPQRMSYLKDFRMAYALYEGLVRWRNDDYTVDPAAAAALPDIEDGGRRYVFRLRPDARWSNGDPVTAYDFLYAWRRAMLPDTAADYSNLFFTIEGAEAFFAWRAEETRRHAERVASLDEAARRAAALDLWRRTEERLENTVGLAALDDQTLEIRLDRPVPYFLDLLCFPTFYPVHQPSVEGWPDPRSTAEDGARRDPPEFGRRRWVQLNPRTGRLEQDHAWSRPGRLVGNGPYVLTEWRYRRDMRLERNPHYRGPAEVRSGSVLAVTIEDTNTAVLAFSTGRIDWLTDVNAEYQADMLAERRTYERRYASELERLRGEGLTEDEALAALPPPGPGERRDIHAFPTFGTDFFSFNCRPRLPDGRANPFHDRAVRQAFALCVEKRTIVEQVTRLHEPIMTTLIPPGSIPGYHSPEGLGYDPALGRARLAEAGWSDRDGDGRPEDGAGDPFPAVELLYTTNSPRYEWMSLELKAQWERELGVEISLRGAETKFYKEDLKQGKFMIARGRWYGDYGDPTTFLNIFRTGDGNNDRGYSDPAFDAMLAAADAEPDPATRLRGLEACERRLFTEELPMVPICQLLQVYMYEPGRLNGLSRHPRLAQYVWQMERNGASSEQR